jgi:hypothetical protein
MDELRKRIDLLKQDIARTVAKAQDEALCKMLVCCGVVDWRTYACIVYQALSPVSVTLVDSETGKELFKQDIC